MRSRLNALFDALLPVLATLAALGVGSLLLAGVGAGRVWGLDALLRPVWLTSPRRISRWLARTT